MKDAIAPPPSIESLQLLLSSLGISDPLQTFPDSNPTTNPVDVFRSFIATTLGPIGGVHSQLIYSSLEWTQSFEKGDLILAIPRLRIKGKKPDLIAKEWAEKVSSNIYIYIYIPVSCLFFRVPCIYYVVFSWFMTCSKNRISSDSFRVPNRTSFPKIRISFP